MARRQTHYELLGVPFGAPEKVIKKAFRRKAHEAHPDRHSPEEREQARKEFEKLKEAYEVLSDPEERALYDRNLANDNSVPLDREKFWTFWRQFLSEHSDPQAPPSYYEKMIMDSYEEDWLEEKYGGKARDRHRFRKALNFGKMHLAQNNVDEAYKSFVRADTLCPRNILSKFYIGYTLELKGEVEEALKRYEFAASIGLSRPQKYVNKCLKIRRRIVGLYEDVGANKKASRQRRIIKELKDRSEGFDQFVSRDLKTGEPLNRSRVKKFVRWLGEKLSFW